MRAAALAALLALAPTVPATAADGAWRIEPLSHADFGVRLLWVHTIRGRFERIAGTVEPRADGRVVVDARIAANSLSMTSERQRGWVLGEDFFDAARYPTLRFVSAPVTRAALEGGGTLDGELTLRGVTRPIQFELLPARCTADACMVQARGQLRRGEFGMTAHRAMLSDRVELALSIVIVRDD